MYVTFPRAPTKWRKPYDILSSKCKYMTYWSVMWRSATMVTQRTLIRIFIIICKLRKNVPATPHVRCHIIGKHLHGWHFLCGCNRFFEKRFLISLQRFEFKLCVVKRKEIQIDIKIIYKKFFYRSITIWIHRLLIPQTSIHVWKNINLKFRRI